MIEDDSRKELMDFISSKGNVDDEIVMEIKNKVANAHIMNPYSSFLNEMPFQIQVRKLVSVNLQRPMY